MRTIGSVEFRSIFPTLVEPVSIVARGRTVGVFYPAGSEPVPHPVPVPYPVPVPQPVPKTDSAPVAPASRAPTPAEQQAARDGWPHKLSG